MNTMEMIQAQKKALEQIEQNLILIEKISEISIKVCYSMKKEFYAGDNREICMLVENCQQIANDNNFKFEFDYQSYSYTPWLNDNTAHIKALVAEYPQVIIKKNKPFGFMPKAVNSQWEDANGDPYLEQY